MDMMCVITRKFQKGEPIPETLVLDVNVVQATGTQVPVSLLCDRLHS